MTTFYIEVCTAVIYMLDRLGDNNGTEYVRWVRVMTDERVRSARLGVAMC